MDPEKVKAISSKGGKAAHVAGTAHEFTREEAVAAGRKGGLAHHASRGGKKRQPDPI
jgi:general stress protein YciG